MRVLSNEYEFTGILLAKGIRLSMDGRGRWRDNVFVERLWRPVKYEEVSRWKYDSFQELYQRLQAYFPKYNDHRPHTALGDHTPSEVYFSLADPAQAA